MVNLRQRCLQGCVVDVRWVDLHSSSLSYSCGFDERPDVFGVAVCGGPERCVVRGGCASEAHAADADGKAGLHDGVAAKVILVDLADCEQRIASALVEESQQSPGVSARRQRARDVVHSRSS